MSEAISVKIECNCSRWDVGLALLSGLCYYLELLRSALLA